MPQRHVALLSLGLLLLSGVMLWTRISTPSDGSVVQLSTTPFRSDRITVAFVLDSSGLRAGDVVTAVDGVGLRAGTPIRDARAGRPVTYSVIRGGVLRTVVVPLHRFSATGFIARTWGSLLVLVTLLMIAGFVFHHRPGDRAAQALLITASLAFCGTLGWLLGDQAWLLPASGPSALDVIGEVALALVWGGAIHFALVAPGTRLRPPRGAIIAAYGLPVLVHVLYLTVALPEATDWSEVRGRVAQVSLLPGSVLPAVAAAVLLVAYRATDGPESRRRTRWLLLTLIIGAGSFVGLGTVPGLLGRSPVPTNLLILMFLPVSLALGASILRYRLFDIEVILRRSLLYGSLVAAVAGLYLAAAWALSRLPLTRQWVALVMAGAVVGLAAPLLRSYVVGRVGRLVYGERDDPFQVVSRLGRIDSPSSDPQQRMQTMAETLAQSLRLPFVAVELRRRESRFPLRAAFGRLDEGVATLPFAHADGITGSLTLAVGPWREPFGPADHRLLEAVIQQVGSVATSALLTTELRQSREQIVRAREEERQHMHRRLQDGVGSALITDMAELERARDLASSDPAAAVARLERLIVADRARVADVRALIGTLRPPALDQLGLAGALQERVEWLAHADATGGQRVRILIEQRGNLRDLPAAVEVAAFRIGVEAVGNVVRHARAATCWIELRRGAALEVEIRDDGRGLSYPLHTGAGLITMRERAEELGGTWRIRTGDGGGTVVEASLPIRSAAGQGAR